MGKTQFLIVMLVRNPRILSFLTLIPTFLRIVGNSAAKGLKTYVCIHTYEEFCPPPPPRNWGVVKFGETCKKPAKFDRI